MCCRESRRAPVNPVPRARLRSRSTLTKARTNASLRSGRQSGPRARLSATADCGPRATRSLPRPINCQLTYKGTNCRLRSLSRVPRRARRRRRRREEERCGAAGHDAEEGKKIRITNAGKRAAGEKWKERERERRRERDGRSRGQVVCIRVLRGTRRACAYAV